MITAIAARELIGANMRVMRSTNAQLVGIAGTAMDETMSMIALRDGGRTRWIPKAGSSLSIDVGGSGAVEVDGALLVGRPHDRRGARR